jgi:hypothetical protein
MVLRATASLGSRLNFVPTHYWVRRHSPAPAPCAGRGQGAGCMHQATPLAPLASQPLHHHHSPHPPTHPPPLPHPLAADRPHPRRRGRVVLLHELLPGGRQGRVPAL